MRLLSFFKHNRFENIRFAKVGYSHVKGREANSASLSALGFEYFDERAGRQVELNL